MLKPAIILSGHTMALGVVRSLGERGVPVVLVHYEERDMAHVSKYVVRAIEAPHPGRCEKEFMELLREISVQFKGGVLIPVSDETLVAVSRNIAELENLYAVACTGWDVTRKFIDKKFTYSLADAHGIPAPRTLVPASLEEVERYGKTIEFPCLIKPCQSHLFYQCFGTKMFQVDNPGRMKEVFVQAREHGLEVMLQEYIPGDDNLVVNYNAYFWDGKPLAEFTARHVRNAPPWFGSPRVVISQDIPEVLEPGRKILRALGFSGYACTEFKKDPRNGVFKLMEVNGRHNLSTLLAVRCGINFPWLHYRHLAYGDTPDVSDYRKGIYWIDSARDLGYSAMYFKQEKYSVREYLRPYFNPHVFAIFDLKDPRPIFKRTSFLFKAGCRETLGHLGLGSNTGQGLGKIPNH